jgi:hypothetical protein
MNTQEAYALCLARAKNIVASKKLEFPGCESAMNSATAYTCVGLDGGAYIDTCSPSGVITALTAVSEGKVYHGGGGRIYVGDDAACSETVHGTQMMVKVEYTPVTTNTSVTFQWLLGTFIKGSTAVNIVGYTTCLFTPSMTSGIVYVSVNGNYTMPSS